jgi:signal transduction histidine kinase
MRRNAESLLVLAGLDLPRRWSVPVKVLDVLRAALGEVEGYQRVVLDQLGPGAVQGSVASSLAHLLAELIENALTFSPPDRWVGAAGARRPEGYVITVTDAGPGMAPQELETANRRPAGAGPTAAVPSKQLGHYVSGHLAARHGIDVWLESPVGPGTGGTRAVVRVPAALVAPVPPPAVAAADLAG